jgi:subfamily B ATP-binding cassette protein MsbA
MMIIVVNIYHTSYQYFWQKTPYKKPRFTKKAADITAFLQESLSAVRVLKSFVRKDYELHRFDENNQIFRAQMKTVQITSRQ